MNRLENLPDDIVDYIFKIECSLRMKQAHAEIACIERNFEYDTLVGHFFLNSDMTQKEREDWNFYKLWLDLVIDHPRDPHRLLAFSHEMQDRMVNSQYVILYNYYRKFGYI
jgi:hypothetical protein